jgi:hypothetical protein
MYTDQEKKQAASRFLIETDWMVLRHNEQVATCSKTSLSQKEFDALLNDRASARSQLVNPNQKLLDRCKEVFLYEK